MVCGCGDPGKKEAKPLVVFCAAGMRKSVSTIARAYEQEFGIPVRLQFGGSGTLLAKLDIAGGDLYLAADSSYIELAKARGKVAETVPIARMRAGFGVPRGNPEQLATLQDVLDPTLKFGIGNPDAASIGRFTRQILERHGLWENFRPTVLFPTVTELANALKLGTIDAAIIWDAVAAQYGEIDFVGLPEFDAETTEITVGVLTSSDQPIEALRFCRYLSSRDRGLKTFAADGYEPIEGAGGWQEPNAIVAD